MAVDFDMTRRISFKLKAAAAVARLSVSKAYRRPLESPSCDRGDPAGLVSRSFRYRGHEREAVVTVRCHAKVMVGLLRAMLKAPTIQVTASSDSLYSGSYRTWDQQYTLWINYVKRVEGWYMAAHPCSGYHRQGRSLDLRSATPDEEKAMTSVRVSGLKFYHGDAFGDDPHWTLGTLG